jgi:hypothetical protein
MISQIPDAPASVIQALDGLQGAVSLLSCVDNSKWNSLARSNPNELAALGAILTSNLRDALSDIVMLPDA